MRGLGCPGPEGGGPAEQALPHCATTYLGFARGGAALGRALTPLAECARDRLCINPAGSSRANHRQEQTALNAILCALDLVAPIGGGGGGGGARNASHAYYACTSAKAFRMTSDFENDGDAAQPSADETDWNGVHLYTRRGHPVKPYVRFLELRPGFADDATDAACYPGDSPG